MPNSLPISACLVAGAEAHRIRPALESLAGWTAEIVVVVNEDVADGTDALAEEFGARVFREPWKGHIGQKNSVSAKAVSPWLVCIDADEVVPPELRGQIEATVRRDDPAFTAWEFPRCTKYCGRWIRHGDWYPDRVCRLWRQGLARWGGEDPHSRLHVEGRVGRLTADLHHYTSESLDHLMRKTMAYAADFVGECEARGRRVGRGDLLARPLWRFARCYFLRLGLLDGWQGAVIAGQAATYTFLRYAKAMEIQRAPRETK